MQVKSTVKLNLPRIRQLTGAQIKALELTAEALHDEVANAEVIPMDKGTLTGEAFFCDYSDSASGKVTLVHETPYARRLYYHPEYNLKTGSRVGNMPILRQNHLNNSTSNWEVSDAEIGRYPAIYYRTRNC